MEKEKEKIKDNRPKSNIKQINAETLVNNHQNFNINNCLDEKKNKNKSIVFDSIANYFDNNKKINQNNNFNKFNKFNHMKQQNIRKTILLPKIINNKKEYNNPIKINEVNKDQNTSKINININQNKNSINNLGIINNSAEENKNQGAGINQDINNINNIGIINNSVEGNNNQNNAINNNEKSDSPPIQKNQYIKNIIPNGLINVGEPLCMNAILQCFANVKNLTEKILFYNLKYDIQSNIDNKYTVTKLYAGVLEGLWVKENKLFSPEEIKKIILIKNNKNLISGKIEPNELILFLLDNLHRELNKPVEDKNMINFQSQRLNFSKTISNFFSCFQKNYNSIISSLFCGGLKSTITCLQCNNNFNNTFVFNMLIFPYQQILNSKNRLIITGNTKLNIYDCFEYSKIPKFLERNYCSHCKTYCLHFNQTIILYTPYIIIINLSGKNNSIEFDLEEFIDIKKYITQNECFPTYYELIGIVYNLVNNGIHKYIAFCKNFMNQKWFKYDDTNITESSFDEASKNGIPCILFYSFTKNKQHI